MIISTCQDPPVSSMHRARLALQLAEGAGAIKFAEPQYREAETLLQKGNLEIARQKGRFAPFRNYHNADSILNLAYMSANKAAIDAKSRYQDLDTQAENAREGLKNELTNYREALDGALANFNAERYWSTADLALKMSQQLIIKGEFVAAIEAVRSGRESLSKLSQILNEYANDEAQKIRIWRRWVQETIDNSRANGSTAIIVDKSAHKLYIVEGGKVARKFDCELGYNSGRQKFFSGDGATPEGQYIVTRTKHNGSKFYKALLINYPNQLDKKRFAENKSKGIISRYARIGALIEIHGNGGRNDDWTDGCVAVTNGQMDSIMQYATVGMPVTIVRRSDIWP